MFYFLLFHSSITKSKDIDKKILITVLYGSILYIIFHAITSSSTKSFLVTIKKYFFLIFTLDVICMIYVLKNFLPQINVKDKFNNMQNMLSQINLFGLIDTSFYDNNNEIKIDNINLSNTEEFEKLNKLNDLLQNGNNTINTNNNNNINTNTNNNTNPSSILKKNVSIREDKNEINEIENIKHQEFQNQEFQNQEFQNQEFQNQELQNQEFQNQELKNSDSNNNLNNELQNLDKLHTLTKNNLNSNNTNNKNKIFNNSMNVQNLPQIGAINMETPISKIRNQNKNDNNITETSINNISQTSINKIRQKQNNQNIHKNNNNNITETSINKIRQKQNNKNNTLHKEIEENIMKKDTINNEELNELNLNYNPSEIFKDIQYNTKKSNDLLNNQNSKINNLNNKNLNINQSNFDNQSLVSNSDIGSVLDLDMDEFENNLDF